MTEGLPVASTERLTMPCANMIFDPEGYHKCNFLRSGDDFCICAWFYDVCNPGFTVEISVDSQTGKTSTVSTFGFPDGEEYKDMVENTKTEEDVPKLCPRGFSYEQIDAKIKILNDRVQWDNRPSDQASRRRECKDKEGWLSDESFCISPKLDNYFPWIWMSDFYHYFPVPESQYLNDSNFHEWLIVKLANAFTHEEIHRSLFRLFDKFVTAVFDNLSERSIQP